MLGRVARVRRAAGRRRDFVAKLVEQAEALRRRRPARPRHLHGTGRRRSRGRRGSSARSPRRAHAARCTAAASALTDGDLARGTYLQPTVVEVPRDSWIWTTELFVPLIAVDRGRLARRGVHARQRHAARPHRGDVQRGAGRGRRVPRPHRGRASSTSTGRRARRPARGPACSRSAAGRARARTARRAAARTTCSSTSASRAERWWVHDDGRRHGPGGRRPRPRWSPTCPGPKARSWIERDQRVTSPSMGRVYPLVPDAGRGARDRGRRRQPLPRLQRGHRGHVDRPLPSRGGRRRSRARPGSSSTTARATSTRRSTPSCPSGSSRGAPIAGASKVFLTNSGTEAVEASIKLARHATGRQYVIAFLGAFHGRSLGSLRSPRARRSTAQGFSPLLPGVHHAPYGVDGYIEDVLFKHLVSPEEVAAVIVEPIQGEGGYVVPPAGWLARPAGAVHRGTGSCSSPTRSRAASAAPGSCGRSSTRASSPTSCSRARASRAACRSAR